MSDFYTQLEEQLVAAGRRRQTQGRWGRAVAGRGRALVAATAVAALAVTGGAVALPPVLTSSGPSMPAAPPAPVRPPAVRAGSLAGIRVTVLNGTTRTGMARAVADQLASLRAVVVAMESATDQSVARTAVSYRRGKEDEARRVAAALGGVVLRGVTPTPRIGPKADVTVLVGSDRRTPQVPAAPVPATPKGYPPVPPAATVPATTPARPTPRPAVAPPASPKPVLPRAATVPAPAPQPAPPPAATVPRPATPTTPAP